MVPTLVQEIGLWIDKFSESLTRWESILCDMRSAYLRGDQQDLLELCRRGEAMQDAIHDGKRARSDLLERARAIGYDAPSIKDLSRLMDASWPALWTHRLQTMEQQLMRIEQLSVSLWITAFQARDFVSDMIRILSTGRASQATYCPSESDNREGGYLVNEAA